MRAASGQASQALLDALRKEEYFAAPPPKSTGLDLFQARWLDHHLQSFPRIPHTDVQATLAVLTASTIADAIARHAADVTTVYVCGGGAYNPYIMLQWAQALQRQGLAANVQSTETLGIVPNHVEAIAFAWLALRFNQRLPGKLPLVTGHAIVEFWERYIPTADRKQLYIKKERPRISPRRPFLTGFKNQAENEEPQPQVVVAFGFLITNCAPSRSSL